MKASNTTFSFRKTADCPSSSTLLLYRAEKLSPEVVLLVRYHLEACDFCTAEIPLLAHYRQKHNGRHKPPEIPMNLRILAESILGRNTKAGIMSEGMELSPP
jgi:hypothetical protein